MKRILPLIVLLLLPLGMDAQKRSAKRTKTAAAPKAETPPPPLFTPQEERMLEGLEKVVVFDSVVINKRELFKAYPLLPSAGTLSWASEPGTPPDSLLTTHPSRHTIAYGDKRVVTYTTDNLSTAVGISWRFNGQWTEPEPIFQQTDTLPSRQNFPYLMADGQTVYFAQEEAEGLGGLDIYMTRQNSDRSGFYRPENIGMPFNSTANDYLLVIDDESGIGMFASDRRQAADSVCIYYFIPSEIRNNYDGDALTLETRLSLARLDRIADTWTYGDTETINRFRKKLEALLKDIRK